MKTINKIGVTLLFLAATIGANAQYKDIRQGNRSYHHGNYAEAEGSYKESLNKKYNDKAQFNLGNTYYQQQNYTEAANCFGSVTDRNVSKDVEAKAFYNLGNSMMEQQKYQEAFDSYKKSLKLNPDDEDARYNLEYARQKLILQQQQQQEQQQNQRRLCSASAISVRTLSQCSQCSTLTATMCSSQYCRSITLMSVHADS